MRKPGNELFLARKSSSKKRHVVSIEKNNIDKYIRQLVSARTREKPFSFLVTNLKKEKRLWTHKKSEKFFGGAEKRESVFRAKEKLEIKTKNLFQKARKKKAREFKMHAN